MAMAPAVPAALSSASSLVPSSSRISPVSTSTSSTATLNAHSCQALPLRCAKVDEEFQRRAVSRREVFSLAALSLFLASGKADAKDIPLFGIKKKVQEAEKAVEKEVTELGKEGAALFKAGEKELAKDVKSVEKAVTKAVGEIEVPTVADGGLSPTLQAGSVVGAELVAVLVASSVVSGLTSVPSK